MPKLINVPGVGRVPVPDDYSFEQILDLREQLQKKSGIEPDLTPQFGLGELLGRGFERGVERTKIAFGDVLPAMIGSGLGYEDFAKRQMEEAAVSEQALQERLPARYKSYEDIKGLGDIPGYAVETIGEAGPDILTSLFPGGAGAVAGRIGAQQAARQALAGAARQGLAREAAVKAAQEAAEKSATRGMLAGTYLGSYAQSAPEVFQNIYQETGAFNPTVAALYGGLSAALDSILPATVMNQLGTVGKGALIREMVKESGADPKVWQTIGKGVAKGFATEGLTETAQEFVNNLAVKTLKENYDLFSPENVTRYIDSFLRGAIVGGGISLPSSTIEAVRERGLVKARQQEEAAKVAEGERVQAEQVAAQQKLDQENQILSQIPQGIEPIKVGEDIFTVEKTGAAGDLIPRGYIVSGVQDRQVDTLDEAESLKAAMESTREDDIKAQEEERTKLIEKLAKLDEQLDQKQKDVINISKEDFEDFRDKTYPEQFAKLNDQISIKDQIIDGLNKPIEIKPLEEQVPREADEYTTFKRTPEGQQAISRHVSPEEAKERLFKPAEEPVAEPSVEPVEPVAEPELVGKGEVTGQPLEELRQELDRLGLPEVGVKLYDALLGQGTPIDGAFAQQTINIAMTPPTRTRLQTLHHEAIHALKEAGLFTAGEWKALSTAAKKDWLKRKWPDLQGKTVADLYADQSPEIQIEEAIAVAFEHYMKKAFSPAGQVASAFQKIANFFGRIKNFFTGKGYQTADDVFDFVASGAMRYKIRPSEVSIGPTKLAKAPPVDTEEFKQWFGDSKVVDKEGKPQVMYTGTSKDKDFSFFKIPGNGAWFSSNPEEASMYAKENDSMGFKYDPDKRTYVPINTASRVLPVYLSIQNPAKLSKEDDEAMRYASNYKKVQTNIFSRLLSEGYDGVDMGGGTWVVLKSPDQIKSAIGNVGAYGQREVTKQEAEQVGLTPAQAKAAQKKGDIRFARTVDITQKLEDRSDEELESYISEEDIDRANRLLTPEVTAKLKATLTLAKGAIQNQLLYQANKAKDLYFPSDYENSANFANQIEYVFSGLERKDLPYAEENVKMLIKQADLLSENLQRRIAENEDYKKLKLVRFARSPLEGSEKFKAWFKQSKAVDDDGNPMVYYHGTARDIDAFRPQQAGAIFVTKKPSFADEFTLYSEDWMAQNVEEWASPELLKEIKTRAAQKIGSNKTLSFTEKRSLINRVQGDKVPGEDDGDAYNPRYWFEMAAREMLPTGRNILPVYVSVQKPFDYDNPQDVDKLYRKLMKDKVTEKIASESLRLGYVLPQFKKNLTEGVWNVIEHPLTQKALKDLGYDGFYVTEGGEKNLAVYQPSQIKSVFNYGTFSPDDRRISFAKSPIADMQESALEKIDAVQSKAQDNGYNLAKSPTTAKQGMNVVNQFMSQSPSFGKKVVDRILDMGTNNRTLVYNFLTLEQMADVGKDLLPELTPYYETFQEMAGYRDKQLYYASKIGKRLYELGRKSPEQTELLADVAHSATIVSFDPDRPVGKNQQITDMWKRLNPEAKQLYRDMRDFYDNRYKAYRALLQERIDSAITDKNKKAEINAKMRQMFETNKVTGPYFPLARFGQYWVSYNDGTERFVMFEKQAEAERFAQDLKAKGLKDVKAGLREEYNLNMPVPNSIIKELIDTVDKAGSPQELKRDLWMAYLTMLPEVSMRKHFIPRKGTPGYSNDIARVFAENTFHGAYNLARLKYAPQFERHIDAMRTRVSEANKKGEGNKPGELFNALLKRQNYIMNPTPSNMITDAAGILGFTWFLTAPASAITNLSQNATVAYPVLGARFGFGKAMNEMLAASRLFMSSGERNIDEPFSIVRALEQRVKESTGAEKKAFQRELEAMNALMDNGTLSRTQAMDLAQMADRPSIVGTKLNTTMKWVGAMFHGAEVFNRSTTAYAAYRMAFEKTGDQDAAIKEATRLVRRSHFDYSASNKPPILQNDFAKVIFMFKQYGINMTYLLLRESQILLKHVAAKYKGTPLEKEAIERAREARDTLIGTLGVTGLFSGVFGLPYPLYLMTMVIANALFGDEEDEIFDAETRFKLWLTDSLGADAADIIAKGPISYLSGADFSERVSANGLIFKDIGRLGPRQAEEGEAKQATAQWFLEAIGPMGGLIANFAKSKDAMMSGDIYRGIEGMVPLPIANGMKAIRYASEGVLTMKGDPIVEEINGYQTFLRAIGYAPTEIARQLEENTAIRAVESQATLSRKQLLNRFALAIHTGDMDALEDIEAAIERFNDKYEGYEITGETLSQSIKARDAARAEVENGLRINKRIRDVYERGSRLND